MHCIMKPVETLGWLLDSCVYRDFSVTRQIKLFKLLLPEPCHTIPNHRRFDTEIGDTFCKENQINVPEIISATDLIEAAEEVKRLG